MSVCLRLRIVSVALIRRGSRTAVRIFHVQCFLMQPAHQCSCTNDLVTEHALLLFLAFVLCLLQCIATATGHRLTSTWLQMRS
jgi:hypothetical protein